MTISFAAREAGPKSRRQVAKGGSRPDGGLTGFPVASPPGTRSPVPVLDGVTSLVDKSLVQADREVDGTRAYRMLETIREFAGKQLAASGEAATVLARLAAHYLSNGLWWFWYVRGWRPRGRH